MPGTNASSTPGTQLPDGSPRRAELLEASYRYVLRHGLGDMSLRPLADAVDTSPRVLLYLFGSKDDLVRALLARARREEVDLLDRLSTRPDRPTLADGAREIWEWLAAPEHRPLLRLWFEAYARSLLVGEGPWAGFARQTVLDWLALLAGLQPSSRRDEPDGAAERTAVLAALRGSLADLLATDDVARTTAALEWSLAAVCT